MHTNESDIHPLKNLPLPVGLSASDMQVLKRAHAHLEHPGLAARLTAAVGTPIEISFNMLPTTWYQVISNGFEKAVYKSLNTAISTLGTHAAKSRPMNKLHQNLGMASGCVGGFFGLPALAIELPFITTLMLRTVADIAQCEGEDLKDPKVQLAIIEVFAFGARSQTDDAAETGYYGVRLALSLALKDASSYILHHGIKGKSIPVLINFMHQVARRFGVALSEKAVAQSMPVLGALGGMTINAIFIKHFQEMAWSHFNIRRLERIYGKELIQEQYELLSNFHNEYV